jgi:hypothetical protein
MATTKEMIERVKADHPDLSSNGWLYRGVEAEYHERSRSVMTEAHHQEQFERAT